MLGVMTFVTLLVAFAQGGWWWVAFLIMVMVWGGTLKQKEAEAAVNVSISDEPQDVTGSWKGASETQLAHRVREICDHYSGTGFHVGDDIPVKKRTAALAGYPPPDGGDIIALVDGTIFNSGKKGLAIGTTGLSWKNGFGVNSRKTYLLWDELMQCQMNEHLNHLDFGDGDHFDWSGVSFDKKLLTKLLRELQAVAREKVGPAQKDSSWPAPSGQVKLEVTPAMQAAPEAGNGVNVNSADLDVLIDLPGIGIPEAKLIVQYRENQGRISSLEQLAAIIKVKPHATARLRGKICFGAAGNSPPPPSFPHGVGRTVD